MPKFRPEPPHQQGTAPGTAVILVNLGTPEAPTAPALKRYLRQFLSDPRVVEIPRPVWWLILNGIILNIRPKKSAEKYASVWMTDGSPLKVHTERQTKFLAGYLGERGHNVTVTSAMRYGAPSLSDVLDRLKAAGNARILVLPMYPQYSASTTATVIDEACRWLLTQRNQPEMRFVRNFHDDPEYISALEQTVRNHWVKHGPPATGDQLIISFHGLPRRNLDLGDPAKFRVRVRTLVLWGESDAALPVRLLEGIDELVDELTIQRLPEATHWLAHEEPQRVAAAIHACCGAS